LHESIEGKPTVIIRRLPRIEHAGHGSELRFDIVRHSILVVVAVGRPGLVTGDMLKFEITDDGRGGADPAGGSGILGLRDRAEAVGGTLFVISPPGKGTLVTAQLPLSGA
jgi:glucose-6-phosphate-specific signal transduction histidine kinase